MKKSKIVLAVLVVFCAKIAFADLVITEIMSRSSISGLNGDWWELTNTGHVSVDLTGYSWDDDHQRVGLNIFGAITIGPGESIIILDEVYDDSVWEWKVNWALGAEVGVYGNEYPSFYFSGLGNGDGVYLYNPSGSLVTSVNYISHTNGFSNQWHIDGTFLGLSILGEYGAYYSQLGGPDVASPGYVPWCFPCYASDIFKDGKIDIKDFSALAYDWLKEGSGLDGDITSNQIVDVDDLEIVSLYWLSSCQ